MLNLKYLITGTGRCGSVFLARLLSSLDLPCTHEAFFKFDGMHKARMRLQSNDYFCSRVSMKEKNWLHGQPVAESSYMAAPHLQEIIELFPDIKIIHLVRNPMNVAESFARDVHTFAENPHGLRVYQDFIYHHLPDIKSEKTTVDRICRFICDWNRMIEQNAGEGHLRLKVEDATKPEFFKFLGKSPQCDHFDNKKINTWSEGERKKFSLDEIQSKEIRRDFVELMKRYDYVRFVP